MPNKYNNFSIYPVSLVIEYRLILFYGKISRARSEKAPDITKLRLLTILQSFNKSSIFCTALPKMFSVTSWWCSASAQTVFTVNVSFIIDRAISIAAQINRKFLLWRVVWQEVHTFYFLDVSGFFLKNISVVGDKLQLFHVTRIKVYLRCNSISLPTSWVTRNWGTWDSVAKS